MEKKYVKIQPKSGGKTKNVLEKFAKNGAWMQEHDMVLIPEVNPILNTEINAKVEKDRKTLIAEKEADLKSKQQTIK